MNELQKAKDFLENAKWEDNREKANTLLLVAQAHAQIAQAEQLKQIADYLEVLAEEAGRETALAQLELTTKLFGE